MFIFFRHFFSIEQTFNYIWTKYFQSKLSKGMLSIGEQIRNLRLGKGLPLRKVAAELDLDQSILSKIERGERKASKEQIIRIAKIFGVDERELLISFFSDKILYDLINEEVAPEVLRVAEMKIAYRLKSNDGE